MGGITRAAGLDLGVPEEVKARTLAYLVVVLEGMDADRVDEDVERLATSARGAGGARRLRAAADVGGAAHRRPGAGVLRRQGGRVRRPHRRRHPAGHHPRLPGPGGRAGAGARGLHHGLRPHRRRQRAHHRLPARRRAAPRPHARELRAGARTSGAPSRASTASGRRSCPTSSSCRIRCRWSSCAPSSGPSTPRASSARTGCSAWRGPGARS